jgi:hypothetical protein
MLVLHGFWSAENGLCLWAEDSDRTVKSPSQAAFGATASVCRARRRDRGSSCRQARYGDVAAAITTVRTAGLAGADPDHPTQATADGPDPAAVVGSRDGLDTAAALTTLDEPVENMRYGASLAYLADLAAFARELVLRGRCYRRCGVTGMGEWRTGVPCCAGPTSSS